MHKKYKGSMTQAGKNTYFEFFRMFLLSTLTFFVVFFYALSLQAQEASSSGASSTKPQLVEIVLNEETNDPEALEIVQTIAQNAIEESNENYEIGQIIAKYIPIGKVGSDTEFIIARFLDEPVGGCYASGCFTVIYTSSQRSNQWKAVFAAYVHSSYYDKTSNQSRPANLVFSSNIGGENPGIWMWNGFEYVVVNG